MEPRADRATRACHRAVWAPLVLLVALALVLFTREPSTTQVSAALPVTECAAAFDGATEPPPAPGTANAGEDAERYARRAPGKGPGHCRPMPAVVRVVTTAGVSSPWHMPPPNTARTALPDSRIPAGGDVLRC